MDKRPRSAGPAGVGAGASDSPRSPKRQRSVGGAGGPVNGSLALSMRRKPAGNVAEQTARGVDAFLGRCAAWQGQLTDLSALLAAQVAKAEQEQVAMVLRDVVNHVEAAVCEERMEDAETERKWGELAQQHADAFAKRVCGDRQAAQEFEAMERQLLEDRVLELETQLQQKRVNEKEKEVELSELRSSHEKMLSSNTLEDNEEFQKLLKERDALLAFKDDAKQKMRRQAQKNSKLNDEVLGLKFQNQDLMDECETLRREKESLEKECEHFKSELERLAERVKLNENSATTTAQHTAEINDKLEQTHAELSATKEEAAAQTLEITRLQDDKAALEEKLAAVTAQCHELIQAQEVKSSSNAPPDRLRSPLARPTPSPSRKRRREDGLSPTGIERLTATPGSTTPVTLKRQATEKELIQGFFQQYYAVAEKKCSALLQEVETLKAETTAHREQALEFRDVLRVCARAEGLGDTTRASLEKLVRALEHGLS